MEILGEIKSIAETQKVSDKFQKREVIIITENNTPYPQFILCQLTQDKVNLLDSLKVGDQVKAQFNLRGRLWNGPQGEKCFITIELWRIEKMNGTTTNTPPPAATPTPQNNAPTFNAPLGDDDILPF